MTTLVIIGNGFDIQNGLPTSYGDFHEQYSSKLNDILEHFPNFYHDQEWSYFEENLAVFNEDDFRESSVLEPSMDDMIESSKYVYGYNDEVSEKVDELVDSVQISFSAWVRSIDVNKSSQFMEFPEGCKFITFNYTPTLQQIYLVYEKDVLHIHGKAKGHIVFGHGSGNGNQASSLPFDENEPWFEEANQSLASVTDRFYKPVSQILDNNRSELEGYDNIIKIIVIGHSINEIDTPYFNSMLEAYPEAIWENWNYDEGIMETHDKLLNIGVPEDKLTSLCSSQLGHFYPCP